MDYGKLALEKHKSLGGALDNKVRTITDQHKIAAAKAIASLVTSPSVDNIIPSAFEKKLIPKIAKVII